MAGNDPYPLSSVTLTAEKALLSMLDSKTIRMKVAGELHTRLGAKWFKPDSTKLVVASADNQTDFDIEFDCYADRRYGDYDCALVVVFKWKKFAKSYKDFDAWYELKDPSSAQFKTQSSRRLNKQFLRVSFDGIDGNFVGGRGPFWVANESDLDAFIAQCVDDLDGRVGEWIKRWFTWRSAMEVMSGNEQLCGSWRDHAYFCLLRQVHGHEAACAWVSGIDWANWPSLLAAHVEYLQSQVCGADLAPPVSTTSAR
ncbi:hypothetical protein LGH82_02000 [Mesorhizobium sp. PAMC28654]|uniref:hypothetical protein n=1 Tax=Mesorhizobium sp. PAMC28654 TaxID=2880934 RepID=UPI001D0B13CA|nr:hypothetical protein [Mesorhizobium sp. PAMC28654]UDL90193.1 hypothetical protein LGH82_02000 [Mesorhizobium sp. PAMC28654]